MQYITKLRQSLTDKSISENTGIPRSTVQRYTQWRSKSDSQKIKDYVVKKVQEFLDTTNR